MSDIYSIDTPANDATSIVRIWPKLNDEQRQWINELNADERKQTEKYLHHYGEADFLNRFRSYVEDLDYVRNF